VSARRPNSAIEGLTDADTDPSQKTDGKTDSRGNPLVSASPTGAEWVQQRLYANVHAKPAPAIRTLHQRIRSIPECNCSFVKAGGCTALHNVGSCWESCCNSRKAVVPVVASLDDEPDLELDEGNEGIKVGHVGTLRLLPSSLLIWTASGLLATIGLSVVLFRASWITGCKFEKQMPGEIAEVSLESSGLTEANHDLAKVGETSSLR